MADVTSVQAMPTEIEHKGRKYVLSPLNLDHIAMFERWLENRAFETIRVRKGTIPEDDYKHLMASWIEHCAAGRYRWGKPTTMEASRSADGIRFLFFLMLAENNPSMTEKLAREILNDHTAEILNDRPANAVGE